MSASPIIAALALLWSANSVQTSQDKPADAVDRRDPAKPTDSSAPQTPEIVITGSRIPRRNLTAVSPVTLVRGEEVKLQGAALTEDLINQLPQVTPDQGAFI